MLNQSWLLFLAGISIFPLYCMVFLMVNVILQCSQGLCSTVVGSRPGSQSGRGQILQKSEELESCHWLFMAASSNLGGKGRIRDSNCAESGLKLGPHLFQTSARFNKSQILNGYCNLITAEITLWKSVYITKWIWFRTTRSRNGFRAFFPNPLQCMDPKWGPHWVWADWTGFGPDECRMWSHISRTLQEVALCFPQGRGKYT